ncbi:MAG TPA: hypothetical protein VN660_04825 [Steroidobacteraceae bacterium]|nr:hypothetical protein [Steroidobacteraceae bacterium]
MSGGAGASRAGRLSALGRVELAEYPVDAAWAPDGRSLVVGLANGSIVRLQSAALTASPAEPPSVLQAHTHGVLALAWQKAGRLWASSGQDGRVLLWDARLPEPRLLHEERQWSERLAFAERGNALAVATGRTLRVFDETGTLRYQHVSHLGAISALAWHPRAAELASAGNGGVLLHRIDLKAAIGGSATAPTAPLALPLRAACLCVCFHPEGRLLAAGLQEGSVLLWNPATDSDSQLEGFGARVLAAEWSGNGRYLAGAGGNELVLWDFSSRAGARADPAAQRLPAHSERITAIGFRPGGNWFASAGQDRRLLWWRAGAGETPQDAHLLADECSLLRFSRDGTQLAVGDASGVLSIFECRP